MVSSVLVGKLVALGLIPMVDIFFAVMPLKLKNVSPNHTLLCFFNFFVSGLLLTGSLVHVLPEALASIFESKLEEHAPLNEGFPLIGLAFILGFFFVSSIENIIGVAGHGHTDEHEHQHQIEGLDEDIKNLQYGQMKKIEFPEEDQKVDASPGDIEQDDYKQNVEEECCANNPQVSHPGRIEYETPVLDIQGSNHKHQEKEGHHNHNEHNHEHHDDAHHHEHSAKNHSHGAAPISSNLKPILFSLSTSLHSFLEGLTVGLSLDFSGVLIFTLAILLHEWAIALSLGVQSKKYSSKLWATSIAVGIFALSTPSGILLGMLVGEGGGRARDVLFGVAGGNLMYIGAVEILSHELRTRKWRKTKMIVLAAGVAGVLGLYYLQHEVVGHEHAH